MFCFLFCFVLMQIAFLGTQNEAAFSMQESLLLHWSDFMGYKFPWSSISNTKETDGARSINPHSLHLLLFVLYSDTCMPGANNSGADCACAHCFIRAHAAAESLNPWITVSKGTAALQLFTAR